MRFLNAGRERGAVLVVALLILLMVSVLGLSAMRSSIFSTKVATGIQADTMTFDAAESAIAQSMKLLADEQVAGAIMTGQSRQNCMKADGTFKTGICGEKDHMDSRSLLRAGSYMVHLKNRCRMVSGSDVEIYRDYIIDIVGESDMQSYGIQNNHLQEALKMGLNCTEI